jgi:transaldolase
VTQLNRILEGTKTNVLVASVRSPNAAATLALNGVQFITADVPVLLAMMVDTVTEESAEEFERVANTSL